MKRTLGIFLQISNQWPVQKINKCAPFFSTGHPGEAVLGFAPKSKKYVHFFSSVRLSESVVELEQEDKKKDELLQNFRLFPSKSVNRHFSVQSGDDSSNAEKDKSNSGTEKRKGKSSKAENRVEAPSLLKEVSTMSFLKKQQSDMAATGKHADESDSQPGYWEESSNNNKGGSDSREKNKNSESSLNSTSGIDRGYS